VPGKSARNTADVQRRESRATHITTKLQSPRPLPVAPKRIELRDEEASSRSTSWRRDQGRSRLSPQASRATAATARPVLTSSPSTAVLHRGAAGPPGDRVPRRPDLYQRPSTPIRLRHAYRACRLYSTSETPPGAAAARKALELACTSRSVQVPVRSRHTPSRRPRIHRQSARRTGSWRSTPTHHRAAIQANLCALRTEFAHAPRFVRSRERHSGSFWRVSTSPARTRTWAATTGDAVSRPTWRANPKSARRAPPPGPVVLPVHGQILEATPRIRHGAAHGAPTPAPRGSR